MMRDRASECPACDTTSPGEFDPILVAYVCPTCATSWRVNRGRLVPATDLLTTAAPPLQLTTELPPPRRTTCEICRRRPAAHEDRQRPAMICRACSKRHGVPLH